MPLRAVVRCEPSREKDEEIERFRQQTLTIPPGKKRDKAVVAYEKAQRERVELLNAAPRYLKAYAVADQKPVNARVQIQGDPHNLGPEVQRGFLGVLGGRRAVADGKGSGRLQLADWLTSPRVESLLARVIVNRIWQYHFGVGLVQTPNDFGTRGARPTHPRLLDHLAARFISHDWSIKWLHRRMLQSRAYRQSGDGQLTRATLKRCARIDPQNTLLWKFPRRRLAAEELRDTMLLVSGELDRAPGRGHAFPPEHEWKFGQHTPYIGALKSRHRSVYLMRQRLKRHPFLVTFDAADPNVATGQRSESTTALQALWLMNNADFHARAQITARRLLRLGGGVDEAVCQAHVWLTGQLPSEDERQMAATYIRNLAVREANVSLRQVKGLASYVRVLMSSNAFLYVD